MPIYNSYAPIVYSGDGSTNAFPITFSYQLQTDIVVEAIDVSSGVATTLVLGVGYTVSPTLNSPANTGTVVTTATYTNATNVRISRDIPLTQETTWVPNDPNLSTSTMNAVDKLTMIVQDNASQPINPGGDTTTFVRGDGSLSNALIDGGVTIPTDTETVLQAGQDGVAAIKVISGAGENASLRFSVNGSTDPWDMELVYDPDISAWGWQPYGGPIRGSFEAGGDVNFTQNFVVAGTGTFGDTVDAPLYTGAADASLITTGVLNVARVGTGSGASNMFLNGTGQFAIPPAGGGGVNTTTTAPFTVAAVSSPQTVSVTDATGISAGNYILVSDGTHTITGHVTAVVGLDLTVTTVSIINGIAGNTMASGAAVQLSTVPGNNTIQIEDFGISSTTMSTLQLGGEEANAPEGSPNVDLYISGTAPGGFVQIAGYANTNFHILNITSATSTTDRIAYKAKADTEWSFLNVNTVGDVLHATSSTVLGMSKIDASASVTAATVTPALLNVTNSLTDTYLFGYDSGTQHFKMFAPTSGLPSGTAAQFVNGVGAATNVLNGALQVASAVIPPVSNTKSLNIASFDSPAVTRFNTYAFDGVSTWAQFASPTGYLFDAPLKALAYNASYTNIDGSNSVVEMGYFDGVVRTTKYGRAAGGWWDKMVVTTNPTGTQTLNMATASYYRFTTIISSFTIALADSNAVPVATTYAGEMTIEFSGGIGANTVTWPGTITWVDSGTAPVPDATGTTIIKLVRAQDSSGRWMGYRTASASAAAYTDAQARSAVLSSAYLIDGAGISWAISPGVSATPSIGNGAIVNSMIDGVNGIQASKIQNYSTHAGDPTYFLNNNGLWSQPSVGGGGQTAIQMRLNGSTSGMPASGVVSGIGLTASTGMTITKSVVGSAVTYTLSSSAGSGALPFYYVAVPSGSATTDTTNIQNAINTAGAAGGGIVVLQAGLYQINSTITLDDDNVSIIGAGSCPSDGAASIPTTGTNLLWTGATLTGCMFLAGTPGHPLGCRYEGFSIFGGSSAATQKEVGMRFGGGAHCSIRDMAFCNFSSVALDMYSASGDPTDTIKGPNHFSIDNIYIDVGTLYWLAHSGDPLSPSLAIGFRNETFDYGDFFASSINNMFIVHNYIGVWMGNSDSNVFTNLHTYAYPNTTGPSTPRTPTVAGLPAPGLYVTDDSRLNRVFGCSTAIVAENVGGYPAHSAQCSIYDIDFIDPGSIGNQISAGVGTEILITNGSSLASGTKAGTYYSGPNSGSGSMYSILFNESLGKVSITNRSGTVTSF